MVHVYSVESNQVVSFSIDHANRSTDDFSMAHIRTVLILTFYAAVWLLAINVKVDVDVIKVHYHLL